MIKLKVYGSSSKGNSYIIETDNGSIMLDCGVKNIHDKVDFKDILGVLLSHVHLDHIGGVRKVKDYYKEKFYSHNEVLDILPILDNQKQEIFEEQPFKVGDFTIVAFEVYHDVKNYNYLLKHNPSGIKILYITDTSSITNLTFKDVDIFLIEANYSINWLDEKEELDYKDYRTYGEQGHLSVEDTLEFLQYNVNHNTKKVILCHISSSAKDYKEMETIIRDGLNNENIEVIAIDPNLKKPLEITLKEEIDIHFD